MVSWQFTLSFDSWGAARESFNATIDAVQAAVDAVNTAAFSSAINNAIAIIDANNDDFVLISALEEQFERERDAAAARS
jgi:ABC-type transporter Mla subunit MlaD